MLSFCFGNHFQVYGLEAFSCCISIISTQREKPRHKKVCINGVSSASKELVTGFPQGSVLGPFMYPVYTSLFDIVEKYGFSIHMYADDTQVYLSFKVSEENVALEKLEGCISDFRNWMFGNHLKLNDTKTIVFSYRE